MAHELPKEREKRVKENIDGAYIAHPCLQVFCYCCLPEISGRIAWNHPRVRWSNVYLRSLFDADIGIDGFAITQTFDHGTGFYVSHSTLGKDVRYSKMLTKVLRDRLRRCVRSADSDIQTTDDKHQTEYHIAACDVFIPIITPHYKNSLQCMQELQIAQKYNKFIIPIIFETVWQAQMPSKLGNVLPFEMEANENGKFTYDMIYDLTENILTEIKEEELHIRCHTKLLLRALFWDTMDFDESILLTGTDVTRAKNWLTSTQLGAEPQPTLLHLAFIRECQDLQLLSRRRQYVAFILVLLWTVGILTPSVGAFTSCCIFLHLLISLSGDQYY